jgi:hypothetical protein
LSGQAASTLSGDSDGGCIKVKSGDSLSQLLLERGYSLKEMLQKDEQGQTLIDRTAAANNLRNPNLIFPGQELNLPAKERQADQQGVVAGQEAAAPLEMSPPPAQDGVLVFANTGKVPDKEDVEFSKDLMKAFAGSGDFNDDQKVDWSEHLRANSLRQRLELWDTNGDGRLDGQEVNSAGGKVWTDRSGEGDISPDEVRSVDPAFQLTRTPGRIEADPEFR